VFATVGIAVGIGPKAGSVTCDGSDAEVEVGAETTGAGVKRCFFRFGPSAASSAAGSTTARVRGLRFASSGEALAGAGTGAGVAVAVGGFAAAADAVNVGAGDAVEAGTEPGAAVFAVGNFISERNGGKNGNNAVSGGNNGIGIGGTACCAVAVVVAAREVFAFAIDIDVPGDGDVKFDVDADGNGMVVEAITPRTYRMRPPFKLEVSTSLHRLSE
jgi:hypothetical protein